MIMMFLFQLLTRLHLFSLPVVGHILMDIIRSSDKDGNVKARSVIPTPGDVVHYIEPGGFLTKVQIGTPPQSVFLQVRMDTLQTWVPASNASICSEGYCSHGAFDPQTSTSCLLTNATFSTNYKYNGGYGVIFVDNLGIDNLSVDSFYMGIAFEINCTWTQGMLGLGCSYMSAEPDVATPEDNLLLNLVDEGQITTAAYSLWLNDWDSTVPSSLLFGALDTAQYIGTLTNVALYPGDDATTQLQPLVALSSVTATSVSGTDVWTYHLPILVRLMVGDYRLILPQEIAFMMWRTTGAEWNATLGWPIIPCCMRDSPGIITFGIGGPSGAAIRLNMRHLVFPQSEMDLNYTSADGEAMCAFNALNETRSANMALGDTLLMGAYAVFDIFNHQVGLAQVRIGGGDDDSNHNDGSGILTFTGFGATMPAATIAPNQPTSLLHTTISPVIPLPTTAAAAADGFLTFKTGAYSVQDVPAPIASGLSSTSASISSSGRDDNNSSGSSSFDAVDGVGIGLGVLFAVVAAVLTAGLTLDAYAGYSVASHLNQTFAEQEEFPPPYGQGSSVTGFSTSTWLSEAASTKRHSVDMDFNEMEMGSFSTRLREGEAGRANHWTSVK
ncbi:aspartic peptidase domain-containing protein [Xylariales sp. PMI_506]|nr:aspartic peptidase domain-containing protein [Xylariales sp. PMI_506]